MERHHDGAVTLTPFEAGQVAEVLENVSDAISSLPSDVDFVGGSRQHGLLHMWRDKFQGYDAPNPEEYYGLSEDEDWDEEEEYEDDDSTEL